MRPAADVLGISMVCSTMLLKQHSCIDAALGALLALALDTAFSRMMDTNDLPPVSYTHLGLWNAGVLVAVIGSSVTVTRYTWIHDLYHTAAVSYTHLDVYKRQNGIYGNHAK